MSSELDRGNIIELIANLFETRGAEAYLGEAVTVAEHMLGRPQPLLKQKAPLTHWSLPHFCTTSATSRANWANIHRKIRETGDMMRLERRRWWAIFRARSRSASVSMWLLQTLPVCHVDPHLLWQALEILATHSLTLQGGPMSDTEIAQFRDLEFYRKAVRLRLWDDGGKTVGIRTLTFDDFRPF